MACDPDPLPMKFLIGTQRTVDLGHHVALGVLPGEHRGAERTAQRMAGEGTVEGQAVIRRHFRPQTCATVSKLSNGSMGMSLKIECIIGAPTVVTIKVWPPGRATATSVAPLTPHRVKAYARASCERESPANPCVTKFAQGISAGLPCERFPATGPMDLARPVFQDPRAGNKNRGGWSCPG